MHALEGAQKEAAQAIQAAQDRAIAIVNDQVGHIFHQLSMDLGGTMSPRDHRSASDSWESFYIGEEDSDENKNTGLGDCHDCAAAAFSIGDDNDHGPKPSAGVKSSPGTDARIRHFESESTIAETAHCESDTSASDKSLPGTEVETPNLEFQSNTSVKSLPRTEADTTHLESESNASVKSLPRPEAEKTRLEAESNASVKSLPGINEKIIHPELESSLGQMQGGDVVQDEVTQSESTSAEDPSEDVMVVRSIRWSARHQTV
jgi:hypothetical protein